ncbi:MAG: YraN family protein [Patescibacteria group bacterium]|nr:YraN family protein [Patescibacteria group bacterium]
MHTNKLGKMGEDYASEYLITKGYKIIGRNVQVGRGEIDIISKYRGLIVFFEVKTRKNEDYQDLYDTIGAEKEEALIESCEKYLNVNDLNTADYRIDLIGIMIKNSRITKVEHVEGIL